MVGNEQDSAECHTSFVLTSDGGGVLPSTVRYPLMFGLSFGMPALP